jgi:hypothetical protein
VPDWQRVSVSQGREGRTPIVRASTRSQSSSDVGIIGLDCQRTIHPPRTNREGRPQEGRLPHRLRRADRVDDSIVYARTCVKRPFLATYCRDDRPSSESLFLHLRKSAPICGSASWFPGGWNRMQIQVMSLRVRAIFTTTALRTRRTKHLLTQRPKGAEICFDHESTKTRKEFAATKHLQWGNFEH